MGERTICLTRDVVRQQSRYCFWMTTIALFFAIYPEILPDWPNQAEGDHDGTPRIRADGACDLGRRHLLGLAKKKLRKDLTLASKTGYGQKNTRDFVTRDSTARGLIFTVPQSRLQQSVEGHEGFHFRPLGGLTLRSILVRFLFATLLIVSSAIGGEPRPSSTVTTSESFVVRSFPGGPTPDEILLLCNTLRQQLSEAWCGRHRVVNWTPRCEIQVHISRGSYVRAVGVGGAQTMGSSLIQLDSSKIRARRIDLLMDSEGNLPALPHELTHVILADRFGGRQPPHWFDEGAAMLADTSEKQMLHERDCRNALHQGSAIPLGQLLRLEQFSSADQMPAFYGQSASLLRFLRERGGIEKVTRFSLDALTQGYDRALQSHYQINNVIDLEKQWKNFAYGQDATEQSLAVLTVRFRP